MSDHPVDPQTPQPGLEPGPTKKLRVAAVGDLHVGETHERPHRELFERVSDDADVLCLCGDLTNFGKTREVEILLEDLRKVQFWYTGGLLTKVRDARGEFWQYKYDAAGRLTTVIDPYHVTTVTNEYAATGRVTRQLDALGAATTFAWDASKQEAKTTDADDVVGIIVKAAVA